MSARRRAGAMVGIVLALASPASESLAGPRADAVLRDAAALRRALRYDAAATKLDAALPQATGDDRARLLVARAALATDPGAARTLLLEAGRATTTHDVRRHADVEVARLDLARGSYRGAQTRLSPYAADPEAAVLLALAAIGLDSTAGLDSLLAPAHDDETAQLLLGWSALQRGDPQLALERLSALATRRSSDVLPTALLWKATAEAQLGDTRAATRTSAELRARFGTTPETDAAARAAQAPALAPETAVHGERLGLQIAAFEDRANALRYRESAARTLPDVHVEAATSAGRDVYRVCVGRFTSRDEAELFARRELESRGLAWQVVRLGPERR